MIQMILVSSETNILSFISSMMSASRIVIRLLKGEGNYMLISR
jgi:hypothetical protein